MKFGYIILVLLSLTGRRSRVVHLSFISSLLFRLSMPPSCSVALMMLGPATRAQLISINRRSLFANGGWTDISISMRGKISKPHIPLMIMSLLCPVRTCWHRCCLKKYERLQHKLETVYSSPILLIICFNNINTKFLKICGQVKFAS